MLAVLAIKGVDDVIIGAPVHPGREFLLSLNSCFVVRGELSESTGVGKEDGERY